MGAGFPDFPRASGIGDDRLNMPRKVERRSGPAGQGDGYDLVEVDDMVSDNTQLFVVFRRDAECTVGIATALGLGAFRPLDCWRGIDPRIGD